MSPALAVHEATKIDLSRLNTNHHCCLRVVESCSVHRGHPKQDVPRAIRIVEPAILEFGMGEESRNTSPVLKSNGVGFYRGVAANGLVIGTRHNVCATAENMTDLTLPS